MNENIAKPKLRRSGGCGGKYTLSGSCTLIALMLAVLLCSSGCGRSSRQKLGEDIVLPGRRLSKVEVKDALRRYEGYFLTKTEEATAEVYRSATNSRMQKTALLGKTRTVFALNSMMVQENPIAALFDTWCYTVRLRQYYETGDGSRLFGEQQAGVLEAAKEVEAEIELMIKTLLGEEILAETREPIHAFARSHPIKGTYSNMVVHATQFEEGTKGPLGQALAVPLSPFKALEGVERTPVAISRFADTTADFADIVQELPESARWQLLLLLYDLQETEMVESLLGSMSALSKSSAQIADTAGELPKQISENLAELVEEIDSKQGNLQTTFKEAGNTANIVGKNLEKFDEVSHSFAHTVKQVNEAASAWEKAAIATGETIKEFYKEEEPAEDEEPFDIKEYRATAEVVNASVSGLRKLLAEVREFAKSDEFDKIASLSVSMTTRITWRAAALVLIILVSCVVYRFIAVRIINRPNREHSPHE